MLEGRGKKDDVGSGMLEYPKGTVKEEYTMCIRCLMYDV